MINTIKMANKPKETFNPIAIFESGIMPAEKRLYASPSGAQLEKNAPFIKPKRPMLNNRRAPKLSKKEIQVWLLFLKPLLYQRQARDE